MFFGALRMVTVRYACTCAYSSVVMATSQREEDEMERLLARVDQQSTLISMLKERADKVQEEVSC